MQQLLCVLPGLPAVFFQRVFQLMEGLFHRGPGTGHVEPFELGGSRSEDLPGIQPQFGFIHHQVFQLFIGEPIPGEIDPYQIGPFRLHKGSLGEVFLHEIPDPGDVPGNVLHQFLHPFIPFGVTALHRHLAHDAALAVAGGGIGFPVTLPQLFIRDDDISRLETCHVEGLAGRIVQH